MKKLVIFDLDGTLLNTIADLGAATNYALRCGGYPEHALTAYTKFVGNGATRLVERALPDEARTPEIISTTLEMFKEYYSLHLSEATEPYPGIPELLEELKYLGVSMAVASNKYQTAVESLVAHYFPNVEWSAVEGQKEGVPVKPDPSILFEILGKVPTKKSKVLYVGDSGVDMETARRACVDSCGVTWGFRPARELREAHADNIIDAPIDILSIVRRPGLELDVL